MNGSGTFRFHRFSEEEKRPYRYATDNKNFYNSNNFRSFQKIKTFQNKFPTNYLNNNRNVQSFQFTTKHSANIPRLYPKTFRATNNNNKNNINKLLYSDNNIVGLSDFPFKQIVNLNFESILSNGDLTQINKFLPQILYNNLSFSNNNHLSLVLQKFQTILRFLFSEQDKLLKNNNEIEDLFNNENSNMNKKIKQIEQEEYRSNNLLKMNQIQIGKLMKKINNYKNILISSGNEKYIPNKKLLYFIKKDGLFICQICRSKIFKTYEDIHAHFIKDHFSSFNDKNIIYNNNSNKVYFENQFNIFKNEIKNTLLDIKKEYDEDNNTNKKDIDIKIAQKNNNNIINNRYDTNRNPEHKSMSSNKLEIFKNFNLNSNNDINLYLDKLENEQKMHYAKLNDDLNQLKKDIFNEIKNIAISQPIPNNNKNIINITENNTNTNIIEPNNQNILRNNNNQNYLNNKIINSNDNLNNNNNINNINVINLKDKNNTKTNNFNIVNNNNNGTNNLKNSNFFFNNNNNFNNNQINNQEFNNNNKNNLNNKLASITEENSNINDSKVNKGEENKVTFTPGGNISLLASEIKINPYSQNKSGSNVNNENKPDKNEFIKLYNNRENEILFNQNNDLSDMCNHYPIIKINEHENLSDERIKNIENQYFNDIFNNVDEYNNIILKIINDNNNKGKNNPKFMEYYENIMKKNKLNEILEQFEGEKKQKEMEKMLEEEKKKKELEKQKEIEKQKELEKEKEEENKNDNKNLNFGYSNQIDIDEIINDKKSDKEEIKEKEKKINNDFDQLNISDKLDKKRLDDSI